MRDVKRILKEIEDLPAQAQLEVYQYLGEELKQPEHLKLRLEEEKGKNEGIIGLQPQHQDYIKKLRQKKVVRPWYF